MTYLVCGRSGSSSAKNTYRPGFAFATATTVWWPPAPAVRPYFEPAGRRTVFVMPIVSWCAMNSLSFRPLYVVCWWMSMIGPVALAQEAAQRHRKPRLDRVSNLDEGSRLELTLCAKGARSLAPQVGFEPTTLRLTAECSTVELLRSISVTGLPH